MTGPELREMRQALNIPVADIASALGVSHGYVFQLEQQPQPRQAYVFRYKLMIEERQRYLDSLARKHNTRAKGGDTE